MNKLSLNVLCAVVLLVAGTSGETRIGGVLKKNTRLFKADGPFILTSDLIVPRTTRLTISSGSKIIVRPERSIRDTAFKDFDHLDRRLVSIRIFGTLSCIGRKDAYITFQTDTTHGSRDWYGIIFDNATNQFNEIAFTTISGAYCGVSVRKCAPTIRRSVFSHNQFGIICDVNAKARIFNCALIYNKNSGIRINSSNVSLRNSIIVFNRNNGIWGDGSSLNDISYNCIAENHDGNFLNCDPELGAIRLKKSPDDSMDIFNNIISNPVFTGSVAEENKKERDLTTPTKVNSIKNRVVDAIVNISRRNSRKREPAPDGFLTLSRYSPCRDAGDPSSRFKDTDGTRNDIGIHGGPDYLEQK